LPNGSYVTGAELQLTGTAVGSKVQLEVIDTAGGGQLGQFTTPTIEWDSSLTATDTFTRSIALADGAITALINSWRSGGANAGLTIRPRNLAANELCSSTSFHERAEFGLGCGFFGNRAPQLLIEYHDPNMAAGVRFDGHPMPSVDDRLDHTFHEHQLVNIAADWHAVGLVDNADGQMSSLKVKGVSSQFDGNKTNYLVIDNENTGVPLTTTQLEVHPRTDGTDSGDYSLYVAKDAAVIPPPSATWQTTVVGLYPGRPLHLFGFNFPGEHTLAVRVKLPANVATVPEFFGPRPNEGALTDEWIAPRGTGTADTEAYADGEGNAIFSLQATKILPGDARWALVIPLDEIAINCPVEPPGYAQAAAGGSCTPIPVEIETLACPLGEYPTRRWGCQPVVYPHEQLGGGIVTPLADNTDGTGENAAAPADANAIAVNIPHTRSYTVGNVRIFSQGGFIGEVAGDPRPAQGI
ncbi:MAG: hypothetical protein KDE58_40255, partial [Caldilineaceae bacterium]|nr:hypothetical protein [Caldilineaceae bacterium]